MKAQRRYELAEQSLRLTARNREIDRKEIHLTAIRYKLHPAQERRLVAALRKEEGDGGTR